jgi:hypothetical protein
VSAPIADDTLVQDERIDASRDKAGILLAGDTTSRPILLRAAECSRKSCEARGADARTV